MSAAEGGASRDRTCRWGTQQPRRRRARSARVLSLSIGLWLGASGASVAQAAPTVAAVSARGAKELASEAPIELSDIELRGVTRAKAPPVPLDEVQAGEASGAADSAQSEALRIEGLALLSFADGIGLGAQLRRGALGLRATVGYDAMLFIADDDPQDTKMGSFEFASSLQLNLDSLLVFGAAERGASIGYRYNTVLGHGAAVAYQSTLDALGQRFIFTVPFIYFPQGTERVRKELGLSRGHRINYPFGAGFQYGMGLAWAF